MYRSDNKGCVRLLTCQGPVQARAPQYQQMLIALVIDLGMLGPSARVSVDDLYSGAVHRSVRSGEQAMQQASSRFSSGLGAAASATASRSGESFDARLQRRLPRRWVDLLGEQCGDAHLG
ncbi:MULTISPECIES: hypothetical protein [unclassified Thiocapsa]|uniref:hypothetical protein n=1 Tax=unclassified Thiocapsa TaxID=2641286 RepID=UPI0035B05BA2